MKVSDALVRGRMRKELSVNAAAKITGCSTATLWNYERGNRIPQAMYAYKLVELYDINVEAFEKLIAQALLTRWRNSNDVHD